MNQLSSTTEHINKLKTFRQASYQRLGAARDALFECGDAALLTTSPHSLADLSQCPVFRRRWSSVYESFQDGRIDRYALAKLYSARLPAETRLIVAGDHTAWPRLYARTLPERTVEHQPNHIPGAKPITVGQGYATLAWVPEHKGSWAVPILHQRIPSDRTAIEVAAEQLRWLGQQHPEGLLALFDAEYGCAAFVNQTADIPREKVVRLRPNLCLWKAPPSYKGHGRPALHGHKFKLKDKRTWGKPLLTMTVTDPNLGEVHLSLWSTLHFKKAARYPFYVLRVERLAARGTRRDPQVMWLAWLGHQPNLANDWNIYLRRFAVDHWYRFAKQSLHWTLPAFRTPAQMERWSDLMPLLTWQLWLARSVIVDKPLPWQATMANPSPGRVQQSLGAVLMQIGTPARAPKPRGKSPGWEKGRVRQRACRYSIVKKRNGRKT